MTLSSHAFLLRLGLSDHEATTYLALLEHGPGGVSDIARWTGLFRPALYRALGDLAGRTLVETTPHGRYTHYVAAPPDALEQSFGALSKMFDEQVAALISRKKKASSGKVSVRSLEGAHAVRDAYRDVVETLPRGGVYYRYSSSRGDAVGDEENDRLSAHYRKLRDEKGIERFVITSETNKRRKRDTPARDVRTLAPSLLFDQNIAQVIYGPKVSFLDYDKKTAIIIEDERFATFQREVFKTLWKKLG